jgi:hypothetical protein
METSTRRGVVAALLGLVGAATLGALVATRDGAGLSPDGVTYISSARNLADGHGFTDFTGGALTVFPPGYPGLLAVGELVGVDAATSGRVANMLAIAAVVVFTFLVLRRHVTDTTILVGATAFIAFSIHLLRIVGLVASDPVFIASTLAFILVMEEARSRPDRRIALLMIAAGIAGVAFLFRYAASALLVSGVVIVALLSVRDGLVAASRRVLGFGLLAGVLPGLWVLRNATTDAPHVLGLRVAPDDSLLTTVKDMVATFKHYVFPDSTPNALAAAGALVLAAVLGMAAWRVRGDLIPRVQSRAASLVPLAVVAIVYTAFLVVSRRTTGNEIAPRILLPVWIPLVVVGAAVLQDLLESTRRRGQRWLTRLVAVSALAVLAGAATQFLVEVGTGAATDYRADNRSSRELRRGLRELPSSARLLSNDPWRIYAAAEENAELAPMEVRAGFSHEPVTVAEIERSRCTGPVFVVWFRDSPASRRLPARSLTEGTGLGLDDGTRIDGGVLYEVSHVGGGPRCPTRATMRS